MKVRTTAVLFVALSAAGAAAQTLPAEAKRGAALYAAHCTNCHGEHMKNPQWGIDLATFPRSEPQRFVNSVTYGLGNMPPWGDLLKPDDIKALWAYVVAGEK